MPENDAAPGDRTPVLLDVTRSELLKLLTVRSTYLTLAAAVVVTVGAAIGLCEAYVRHVAQLSLTQLDFNPTSYSLSGILLAQLAVGALGVLAITSEHGTGMIRATFAAVPQRGTLLLAKALAFTAVTLTVGELASFAAFGIGQLILAGNHAQTSFGSPGVLRAVIGAGLYLAVLGLLALAVGTLIRHSAGAIAALYGLLLVLPALTEGLPHPLQDAINPYLPGYAGQAIFHTTEDTHLLPPWQGFAVFTLYTATALTAATVAIRHRDL